VRGGAGGADSIPWVVVCGLNPSDTSADKSSSSSPPLIDMRTEVLVDSLRSGPLLFPSFRSIVLAQLRRRRQSAAPPTQD